MTEVLEPSPLVCECCEPHLELLDPKGKRLVEFHEALQQTKLGLLWGKVIALRGFGQTIYATDSRMESAVSALRQRTQWGSKSLPLLYPTMEMLAIDFAVSEFDCSLLTIRQSPALLPTRKHSPRETAFAFSVAGNNQPFFRVMLPRSPLQCLIVGQLGFPLVAVDERSLPSALRPAPDSIHHVADFALTLNCPVYSPDKGMSIRCGGPFCDADWTDVRTRRG